MEPSTMNYRIILLLSAMLLLQSFCFLPASGQSQPPNTTFDFKIGANATLQGNTSTEYIPFQQTAYLVSGNVNTLSMVAKYTANKTGPFCYLEVVHRDGLLNNVTLGTTIPWTKPCPRTPLEVPPSGFWCMFEFTADGNLVLRSGAHGTLPADGAVLWSSNTSGLGAQSLELVDGFGGLMGNLVLYNANRTVLWDNVADNPASERFQCTDSAPAPAPAPATNKPALAPALENGANPSLSISSAFTIITAMAALISSA